MNPIANSNTETTLSVGTALGGTPTGSNALTAVTGIAATDTITAAGGATIATSDTVAGSISIVNTGSATGVGLDVTGGSVHAAGGVAAKEVDVLDTGAANLETNQVTGSIHLAVGGQSFTYTAQAGDTWQSAIQAINGSAIFGTSANTGGVTAAWNANAGGTGIGGITLTSYANNGSAVVASANSLKSATVDTFNVGQGANNVATNTYYTNPTNNGATQNGNTLAGLAATISAVSGLQVTAQATSTGLLLTQSQMNGGTITSSANTLTDVTAETPSSISSSEIANKNDSLSGSLVFNVGIGASQTVTMANVVAGGKPATAQGMVDYINANSTTGADLGITAKWVPDSGPSANTTFGTIQLTSNMEGSGGTVNVNGNLTSLTDTTVNSSLSYTQSAAYKTGLSNGTVAVSDHITGQAATFTAQNLKGSGIATISYSDQAGQSLSATDLTNSTDAKASLTALNAAITDVASQDGYIGAQINTLNSVSSVLATQQQNVVAAQNAVQATDYASAASNMSKYEILSQTGISALAQANSMQQEVTKLLQ